MKKLLINIKELVGTHEENVLLRGESLSKLPSLKNAFLLVENDEILSFGEMKNIPEISCETIDVTGKIVLPSWCDSHTHIVFAGSRENEFVYKLKGLSYAEIAAKGGGILNSSKKLNDTSEEDLFNSALQRLKNLQKLGTGAIEIKSGYGLSLKGELKMLRVIKKLREETGMIIKSSLLAAHTFPEQYKENQEEYVTLIIKEIIPAAAEEKLADYIDVFCEKGFFSPKQTEQICIAAADYGLRPKLHVNQLNSIGGIETGIKNNALSLDHLETLNADEIKKLGLFSGVCTLLPTPAFYLRMQYQPARELINADAAIAIASDFNPGSSPSGNMNFVASLSAIQMKMLPEEVINAGTINGAFAMEVQNLAGSISKGKKANIIITKKIESITSLMYYFGDNLIDKVMLNGKFIL